MALEMRQNFNLRMEQRLKLTPQMIQKIEILLLPQMALEERIMHEVESNPVLELADAPEDGAEQGDDERGELAEPVTRAEPAEGERFSAVDDHDERWNDFLKSRRRDDGDDAPDKMQAIEATAGPPPSLAEHLLDQLRFVDMDADVRETLPELCWALDHRGYLTESLAELFPEERLDAAERAWELVRSCEPTGVGARDLRDCLLLQLEHEQGDNSFEMGLIREQLDNILRNRLPAIAQEMGVEVDRVQEGVEVISQLDPHPGLAFTHGENQFVVPDVVVERDEAGEWQVHVPDSHLPRVRISDAYYQLYDSDRATSEERSYLKEKFSGARFLLDAVAQRKQTLLKIATEIVIHQKSFLELGPEHLRPLMRQDIADRIGMHVATVSRAVKDKYIQTPAGVLPLSAFFSGGIATTGEGEAESSRSVKLKIKAMIEQENPRKPFSDQAIADALGQEGLDISRRTVTKYRIAMEIPSTRQRRRFS